MNENYLEVKLSSEEYSELEDNLKEHDLFLCLNCGQIQKYSYDYMELQHEFHYCSTMCKADVELGKEYILNYYKEQEALMKEKNKVEVNKNE